MYRCAQSAPILAARIAESQDNQRGRAQIAIAHTDKLDFVRRITLSSLPGVMFCNAETA